MYRMPEKKIGSQTVSNCTRRCFYQYTITHHLAYFPSIWNILAFLRLFDLLLFILYYMYIFVKAKFFHVNLRFQKEKTSRKCCVYNHGDTYLFCFTNTYNMQITLHSEHFSGDKNVAFNFSDACLYGHPTG